MDDFKIILAEPKHYAEIANMLKSFGEEIQELTGQKINTDSNELQELCSESLDIVASNIFVGVTNSDSIGFIHIVESFALYTGGKFGIIQEFYIKAGFRSKGYGKTMLDYIKNFAKKNNWKRLELATPPLPVFSDSLRFYQREGFDITGGAKLKSQF